VRHVAALARLGVDEARIAVLAAELSGILEHMAALQEIDTSGVAAGPEGAGAPLRADAGPPIPLARPLAAFAPAMRDGFFLVPRLATHGDTPEDGG
jgi:aspartyl-tRNA(Asn)/glutamyl-tRNA(Gln) amidotransferase subunit C